MAKVYITVQLLLLYCSIYSDPATHILNSSYHLFYHNHHHAPIYHHYLIPIHSLSSPYLQSPPQWSFAIESQAQVQSLKINFMVKLFKLCI